MILAAPPNLHRLEPLPAVHGAAWQRGVSPEYWRYAVLFNGRPDRSVVAANDVAGWVLVETSRRIDDDGVIHRGVERRRGRVRIQPIGRHSAYGVLA